MPSLPVQTLVSFIFFFSLVGVASDPQSFAEPFRNTAPRLSKLLLGDDGRIYACSDRNFFAFESNGTIAWTIHLNYTCNAGIAPVHVGRGKVLLVAENRILRINFSNSGTSNSAAEVFFGPEPGQEEISEIIGLSVSTSFSSVFITIKNRGVFAFMLHGEMLWSAGPVLNQFGYRQGCKKNVTDCYFTSAPVIDLCEASVYISNNEGELYSLSVHTPHFRWIQDFSSFDKTFSITPGNNGRLYVVVPVRALVFALDVFNGHVLWQRSIGPLSTSECAPVVDANGWISVGSLDGFLYSFSLDGTLTKFSRAAKLDSVIQVGPLLDCSGFAVYVAQTEMEGKTSFTIGEHTYTSVMKSKVVVFTMLVPASGSIYWSKSYPGKFSSSFSGSDLRHFILDEGVLLAFITASKFGNPLPCRSTRQKLASTCSKAKPRRLNIYTGNERAILVFLLFESLVLILLAGLVQFCCVFWRKKKLKDQNLGNFLEERRSLQVKRKAFDRTITELELKVAEEAVNNEVLEEIGNLVREREGIERKLSTTYSLGRDTARSQSNSLLPLYDGASKRYSFQGSNKGSITIFHTLSDTSKESSSESESGWSCYENKTEEKTMEKAKGFVGAGSSSDDDTSKEDWGNPSGSAVSSKEFRNPLYADHAFEDPR